MKLLFSGLGHPHGRAAPGRHELGRWPFARCESPAGAVGSGSPYLQTGNYVLQIVALSKISGENIWPTGNHISSPELAPLLLFCFFGVPFVFH